MTTARNRTIALLVCLLVAAAGCSRAEPSTSAATLAPAPSPTESATAAAEPAESTDPYAIPADPKDIDKTYVQRVLNELGTAYAAATREVVASRAVTRKVGDILSASHTPDSRRSVIADFRQVLRADRRARPLAADAQAGEYQVQELLHADRQCIYSLVRQDLSGLVTGGGIKPYPAYYYLVARQGKDDRGVNPTPWLIAGTAEPRRQGKEFANPCSS